jgi:hypothetical protein
MVLAATPGAPSPGVCATLAYVREYWGQDHEASQLDDALRLLRAAVEAVEALEGVADEGADDGACRGVGEACASLSPCCRFAGAYGVVYHA